MYPIYRDRYRGRYVSSGTLRRASCDPLCVSLSVFLLCFFCACIWITAGKKEYYESLLQVFEDLDEKRYLSETVERPSFLEGKICHSILRQMEKDMNDQPSGRKWNSVHTKTTLNLGCMK